MSEIKEYKCPACGGAMEFDSKSQKMKCPYCDTEISVDEYESVSLVAVKSRQIKIQALQLVRSAEIVLF